ncbi:sulfite exporter TauE/SafE family protein [Lentzea sp. NPDC004782]|uniref:sulfite exporter TauE/SafE family protein n=1 Tax=Lentzea sp. NPDC004782 TaxID=3154458 RepID=UPI0033BBAD9C
MLPAALFGLVIGAVLGTLGAGGSILAVPALVYGVGVPLATAVPTSLIVVAVSALGGLAVRWRTGAIRWPVALVFTATSIPAAFAGTALGRLIPERWSLLAFTALMVAVAARMLAAPAESGGACRTRGGEVNWRRCLPKALAAGAVVGALTGLFGVGGGFVIVPVLTMLLGLTAAEAVATSLVVITITALAGLTAHGLTGTHVEPAVTAVFAGTALVAAVATGRLTHRLPAATLRRAFAWVVIAVAGGVATSALFFQAALGSA